MIEVPPGAPYDEVEAEVTIQSEATGETLASSSGSGYPEVSLAPFVLEPPVGGDGGGGGGGFFLFAIIRFIVGGIVQRILDWFRKVKVGTSILCYSTNGASLGSDIGFPPGVFCEADIDRACDAVCAFAYPKFAIRRGSIGIPSCVSGTRIQVNVPWARKEHGLTTCSRLLNHFVNPGCFCTDLGGR